MFPHTITLYSLDTQDDENLIPQKVYNVTVLSGVMFDATKAANINQSGLSNADSVMIYIPYSVDSGVKTYVGPVEYTNLLPQEKTKHWTLRTGDFLVKGEIIDPGLNHDYQYMREKYDDVYTINTIDQKEFGTEMDHWEVGGK